METLTALHPSRTSSGRPLWLATSAFSPSDGTLALLCAWSCCSAWRSACESFLLVSLKALSQTLRSVWLCIHRSPEKQIDPEIFMTSNRFYIRRASIKVGLFDMYNVLSFSLLCLCYTSLSHHSQWVAQFAMKWHKFKAIISGWGEEAALLWGARRHRFVVLCEGTRQSMKYTPSLLIS